MPVLFAYVVTPMTPIRWGTPGAIGERHCIVKKRHEIKQSSQVPQNTTARVHIAIPVQADGPQADEAFVSVLVLDM